MNTQEFEKLIQKYSTTGPRYTSYPTALEFSPSVTSGDWRKYLTDTSSSAPDSIALYVHVPFCPSLCYFCACNKVITKDSGLIESHIRHIVQEIELYQSFYTSPPSVSQFHWGGGSPSYLSISQFSAIYDAARKSFPSFTQNSEISIEVDPRSVDVDKLRFYREIGFNRISFGVQDFDPHVQSLINRKQPYEMTAGVLESARTLGFTGTNVDLIYGLPGQTIESFKNTVSLLKGLRPDRVALYGYAHVPWITKVQKVLDKGHLPNPAERLALFEHAVTTLEQAGYVHIGMDHFALPTDELAVALTEGKLYRNFMGYTVQRSEVLIGFGPSAISASPSIMIQNVKEIDHYNSLVASGELPAERGYIRTPDDQIRERIIQNLFCQRQVLTTEIEQRWNISFWKYFEDSIPALQSLADDRIINLSKDAISVTDLGRFFIRTIAMAFDTFMQRHRESARPAFSQSI